MKQKKIMMGMAITVDIPHAANTQVFDDVFAYFTAIDNRFSTYKETSEISRINKGDIEPDAYSEEMKEILAAAEQTERDTHGYFSIVRSDGTMDPSGIVKGWAIRAAGRMVSKHGYEDFCINAGGDIEVSGRVMGEAWRIGIRDPFRPKDRIVKMLAVSDCGVATSGSYSRGNHIYNPLDRSQALDEILSITVIGPDVYEADRFATAAFAMQREGIDFIESLEGFEGYMIDRNGIATMTANFEQYTV
jgi:FAD:protein FMN transferase